MTRTARSFARDYARMGSNIGKPRIRKCDSCGKRRPVNVNYVCADCLLKEGRVTTPADFIQ